MSAVRLQCLPRPACLVVAAGALAAAFAAGPDLDSSGDLSFDDSGYWVAG